MQKTFMAKSDIAAKDWYCVDAQDKVLGRLAVQIANVLMGKHRPTFTPHVDTGDFVIVTNAEKIKVTGNKRQQKTYYTWSNYPGGLKKKNFEEKQKTHPEQIVRLAVRRMLPKTKLGRKMLKKLKIYQGSEHPHQAQCPKEWKDI